MASNPGTTMRAARYRRYGPPEVLAVEQAPVPVPGKGEVLVEVCATSVNPAEAKVRAGAFRLVSGFRFPKGTGEDFTGVVVAAGPGVGADAVGRRVWGTKLGLGSAAAAEYVAVRAELAVPAPAGQDLVAAAALPTVGLAALTALRLTGVTAGRNVLVVGAGGGIGTAVVQLAVAAGARVSTVSSAGSLDLCKELGAERTFDYARPGDLPAGRRYDAVIDLHGTGLGGYRRRLVRGGRITSLAPRGLGYAMLSAFLPGPRVRTAQLKAEPDELRALTEHVERGALRPIVERVHPLEGIAEAHRSVESGHSRGKRVIRVAADPAV